MTSPGCRDRLACRPVAPLDGTASTPSARAWAGKRRCCLSRGTRISSRVPHLDAPTSMAARYRAFARLPLGPGLQRLARDEIGGTPRTDPRGYAIRSPLDRAGKIAFAGVPLQIWWSTRDRVVANERTSRGSSIGRSSTSIRTHLLRQFVGIWAHTTEMKAHGYLPYALSRFGLFPPRPGRSRRRGRS